MHFAGKLEHGWQKCGGVVNARLHRVNMMATPNYKAGA